MPQIAAAAMGAPAMMNGSPNTFLSYLEKIVLPSGSAHWLWCSNAGEELQDSKSAGAQSLLLSVLLSLSLLLLQLLRY